MSNPTLKLVKQTNTLKVVQPKNTLILEPKAPNVVLMKDKGVKGEKGDQGEQGIPGQDGSAGDAPYLHVQISAQSVWNVNHGRNKPYPNVVIVDSGGNKVIGEIDYIDNDNLTITFTVPFGGTASVD